MRSVLLGFTLFFSLVAVAQTTVYSNLDDNPADWGSCTGSCAGGASASTYGNTAATSPSVDGSSMEFWFNGPAYTDVLWWNKVGANDAVNNFRFDFWVQLYTSTGTMPDNVQALEFDTFQFIKQRGRGTEYMFGTQCDYASGVWEVWDQKDGKWNGTGVTCTPFTPNIWYHITWNFYRTSDKMMHYDSFTVEVHQANGTVTSTSYVLNLAYPSGPLPSGWSENMGVQFQMDSNFRGGYMQEFVDDVSLTVW